MPTQIFVNLPVQDLERSKAFFTALGFTFNPKFTDENATCLVISDTIFAMLLVPKFFGTFTKKTVADATQTTETILAVTVESREAADAMAAKAIAAGGKETRPAEDHGWMYSRPIEDPDGHQWEFFWQDESLFPKAQA